MLSISDLSKSYGGQALFRDVALQIQSGERVGIVGSNGVGKSTLFRLILGEEHPDAGRITLQRGATVGYLPQESAPVNNESVLELALSISPRFLALWQETGLSRDDGNRSHLEEARREFERLDGHRIVARAKQVLSGLSFRETDLDRPARTLSGGWVMRAHLARLLVSEPDVLLLDEPTNHLDLEALLWFQNHLQSYRGAVLVVSHDREFLNETVKSILEIRHSRVFRYRGDYEVFLTQRQATEDQLVAAYKNQQREIARLQAFVDRFRAKNTKASQAQSKLKQIERMEKLEAPESHGPHLSFDFPQPPRSGQRVIRLGSVSVGYGDTLVYENLEFEAQRGQRIVLVGPNGAGKSTLLKLLAGVLEPQSGARILGHNTQAGYFSQYRTEVLDGQRTVLEETLATQRPISVEAARTLLGAFLFRGEDVFKPVRVLSGGEKSRLALVKLLLNPPNLMLLDEPTTHLDIPSTEALLKALRGYAGTIVFISHDVFFIRELADHVVHIRNGVLTPYPGGYDYYVEKTRSTREDAASQSNGSTAGERPLKLGRSHARREQRRLAAEERQRLSRIRQALQGRVNALEKEIHGLEARQAELARLMEESATYGSGERAADVNREYRANQTRLDTLNPQWEQAATELEAAVLGLPPNPAP